MLYKIGDYIQDKYVLINILIIEFKWKIDFIKMYLFCMWFLILYNIIILCLEVGSYFVINIIVYNCISFGKIKKVII